MLDNSKTILLTFDYELFLGAKSGTVDQCLLQPTRHLQNVMQPFGVKAVFFVDCTYLLRLKEVSLTHTAAKRDFEKISHQLVELVNEGHYLYPHIHPHWMDASYISAQNSWELNHLEKYSMNNLASAERNTIFSNSVGVLDDIIKEAVPNYQMDCYRAGGWCIQPFEVFREIFKDHGIQNDFSVLGGFGMTSNAQTFDFTSIAKNQVPYRFESDVNQMDKEGSFWQFPINSIPFRKGSLWNRLLLKVLWRTKLGQSYGKGIGVSPKIKWVDLSYDQQYQMLSIELLNQLNLSAYKRYLSSNNYMHWVSHPKMISKYNMKVLEWFLKWATKKYNVNFDWQKYPSYNN